MILDGFVEHFGDQFGQKVSPLGLLWASLGLPWTSLGPPWVPLGPLETAWRAKINEKSIQNSIKISIGFLSVSWTVFWSIVGAFWGA